MTVDITKPFPGLDEVDLYPVQNYTYQNTTLQPEEDSSVAERMRRLQDQFDETGIRRSVDAVIVCHDHGLPCVLTFQIANDFFKLLLSVWYRPNFDGFLYPYKPVHVSQPKERRKIFLVTMSPEQKLGVPLNMKLLAIPLHEFYDNTQRYGPQLSSIPHLLSRVTFTAKH
ncbi:uncharacterized protein EHS24_007866 [Apiotrichum porosum]|uniref:Cleavage and polyadenylation specificity factor subunit 5 n=1 Tax=Apiotrichum porosum TaxID=105984 RepID=A0A427XSA1_9TREE|nr:uncharacterized protein EHS24_007866 [Apiotrichum porosum]RSH81683.1 hypothetical protein EHS24_007866 [Apiotrichum porosum]